MITRDARFRTPARLPPGFSARRASHTACVIAVAVFLSGSGAWADGAGAPRSRRGAACPRIDCAHRGAGLAPAGPYSLAANAALGIGFLYTTQGRLTFSFGRRFLDRIVVELGLRVDLGRGLVGLEEVALLGVLLHHSRRWDVLLGGRAGVASFRLEEPGGPRWRHTPTVTGLVEIRHLLTRQLELRIIPVAITGTFGDMWGVGVEPGLGLALRL